MTKPLASLKAQIIDEQIEQMLFIDPDRQDDEDVRYLQDLQYLLRKEEILARVQRRLVITSQSQEASASGGQIETTEDMGPEHFPLPFRAPMRETHRRSSWSRIATGLVAVLVLIAVIIGVTSFFNAPGLQPPGTANAGATATSAVTVLFSDPLNRNIHNWPMITNGPRHYVFQDGAYHILNQGPDIAVVVQPTLRFAAPWSYTLTMTQLQGNLAASTNSFGMVFDYTGANGAMSFYSLEVTNAPGRTGASKIGLYHYDTSNREQPRTELWSTTTRLAAFYSGLHKANTMRITATAQTLVLTVNTQQISILRVSVGNGGIGMLVDLQGSEVAFQHLLVTRP